MLPVTWEVAKCGTDTKNITVKGTKGRLGDEEDTLGKVSTKHISSVNKNRRVAKPFYFAFCCCDKTLTTAHWG